ncbi:glycine/betaine ABC transporter substrate-binding protein [Natronorubrum aibiense]|uniref:Glycine/betaine ABC transporter substrate-binding protein n=1 Tax=Natronorubrum aibiense TaxID=348826 RepID=A0A5P9P2G4_9EURY|nr:glycine/betaine ABC transporter substrate-binding protein [Natronorubrum aibiense]
MLNQHTRRELLRGGGGVAATASVVGTSGCLTLATQLQGDLVKVGSKQFTEQEVLGYLAYEVLKANTDINIGDQVGLGGTTTNYRALLSDEIQLYWEYTGTAWQTLPPKQDSFISDSTELYETVKQEFESQHDLTFLQPAPLDNTYVIMANPTWADETGVTSLSEFESYLTESSETVTVALNAEFQSRSDGWPGLLDHYGLDTHKQRLDVKNIDSGLLYQVVGNEEADIGVGFNTDPRILQFDLQVLDDDQQFFPSYNAAPMVGTATLETNPSIRSSLNETSENLTTEQMRKLNKRVALERVNPQTVAKEYLQSEGIV